MKRKIILGLSLFMSLAIVGGGFAALNGVAETNDPVEVGAEATYPYTYGLYGDRTSSNWTAYFASVEDDGTAETVSFTVELTKGESIKIVITYASSLGWDPGWISYSDCISDTYSAFLSDDGTDNHNYLVNVEGEYTFTFAKGWGDYGNKHYGLTITTPEVEQRSITFSKLFGEDGDYLADETKSVLVGTETLTYASFEPSWVYGFTFDGFYSDASCETSIPLTTEVTADVTSGVWARYLPDSTNVTYTFDYSAGMSTVWNGDYTLAYRYWNSDGSAVAYPGIYVGRDVNGTLTLSVPSDATGLQFVSFDSTGTEKGQTDGSLFAVTPATDTNRMVAIKDGGTADTYGYYTVSQGLVADAAYMTIYNALQTVADACSVEHDLSDETITTAWTNIASGVEAVPAELAHITGITARVDSTGNRVDGLAGLVSVYDFCVNKYSLENPLNRTVSSSPSYHFLGVEENSHFVEIIAVVALSGLIIGGFFFLRKRKGERA